MKVIYGLVQAVNNTGRTSKKLWLDTKVKMILASSFRKLMVMNHCHLSSSMLMMGELLEHLKQSKKSLKLLENHLR
jgi:flagellar biosynthesis regulator FlbT